MKDTLLNTCIYTCNTNPHHSMQSVHYRALKSSFWSASRYDTSTCWQMSLHCLHATDLLSALCCALIPQYHSGSHVISTFCIVTVSNVVVTVV